MSEETLTVAICSYNSASELPHLIQALAALSSPIPFEILLIDNNSTDGTRELIERLRKTVRIPLRYVREMAQGIPFARNRAIEETLDRTYLAFIDADELPDPTWLQAACRGLREHGADCVGGRIRLDLPARPTWMTDSLLPFLGQVDHGAAPLQVVDRSTPIWSGNVAYRSRLFINGLRFDTRYNRAGDGIGGGSDGIMFRALLQAKKRVCYEPEMSIIHRIPKRKLTRRYFLRLHHVAGAKAGRYESTAFSGKAWFGVPRFMYGQLLRKSTKVAAMFAIRNPEYLREGMNFAHHLGMMHGLRQTSKKGTTLQR